MSASPENIDRTIGLHTGRIKDDGYGVADLTADEQAVVDGQTAKDELIAWLSAQPIETFMPSLHDGHYGRVIGAPIIQVGDGAEIPTRVLYPTDGRMLVSLDITHPNGQIFGVTEITAEEYVV